MSNRTAQRLRRARYVGDALTGREAAVLAGLVFLAAVHPACLRAGLGPAGEGQRWFVTVAAGGLILEVAFTVLMLTRAGTQSPARGRQGLDVR